VSPNQNIDTAGTKYAIKKYILLLLKLPPSLSPILIRCTETKYSAQDTNFGTITRPTNHNRSIPAKPVSEHYKHNTPHLRSLLLSRISWWPRIIEQISKNCTRNMLKNSLTACIFLALYTTSMVTAMVYEAGCSAVRSTVLSRCNKDGKAILHGVFQLKMTQWV
jgi:hypothetical protein